MIDYGALPPEINSGRMYTGAGAAPMLAAAAAWDVLAEEMAGTAAFFELTVLDLTTGPWRGPSAQAMAAATLPFIGWLKTTAAQAEQAAGAAKAAAAAYATAFALTVPPPVIAANRAQLMVLIATNFFGQNTPAIAANEAQYAAMWAQDAAAMYGYAGGSQAAVQISPFTPPPQTTGPAGLAGPTVSAGQAAGTTPVLPATSTPPALSAITTPAAIAEAGAVTGTPGAVTPPASVLPVLQDMVNHLALFNRFAGAGFSPAPMAHAGSQVLMIGDTFPKAFSGTRDALADAAKVAANAAKGVGTAAAVAPGGGAAVLAAGPGQAVQFGGLSVPSSWPGAAPVANPAAATLIASRTVAATGEAAAMPRAAVGFPGLPGAAGAGGSYGFRFVPRYGYRHKFMTRPPNAG